MQRQHGQVAEGEVRPEVGDLRRRRRVTLTSDSNNRVPAHHDEPVLARHGGAEVDELQRGPVLPLPDLHVPGVDQLLPVPGPDDLRLGVPDEVHLELGGLRLPDLDVHQVLGDLGRALHRQPPLLHLVAPGGQVRLLLGCRVLANQR